MDTVKECIERGITAGEKMLIRSNGRPVTVISTERVELTKNSLAVKEADGICFYISVDSLIFDTNYCGNCNGTGMACGEACHVCWGTGTDNTLKNKWYDNQNKTTKDTLKKYI